MIFTLYGFSVVEEIEFKLTKIDKYQKGLLIDEGFLLYDLKAKLYYDKQIETVSIEERIFEIKKLNKIQSDSKNNYFYNVKIDTDNESYEIETYKEEIS